MTTMERDRTYIEHMLECIDKIQSYTKSDSNLFFSESVVQDAVLRVLQVLAESGQRLSPAAKESQPQIDWRGISGFRNILVHDYLGGIDLELVWKVITDELPNLEKALKLLNSEKP